MLNRLPRLLVSFALVFWGAGCATKAVAPPIARESAPVRLVVSNLTSHAWRISVRQADGAAIQTMHIDAQHVAEIRFARGNYVIEQVLLDVGSTELARREFNMQFEAAGDYRWELATLLSANETFSAPAATTETASRE
jgi:hypothetical protein